MTKDELKDPQWNKETAEHISSRVVSFSAGKQLNRHQTNTFEAQDYVRVLGYAGNPGIVPAVRRIIQEIRAAKYRDPFPIVLPSEVYDMLDARSGGNVAEYVKQFDKPEIIRPTNTTSTRKEAMDHLVAYLNDLAPGTEFTPSELADKLSGQSGKSTSWYRMVVATDLTALGIVEFNPESGRFRVTPTT